MDDLELIKKALGEVYVLGNAQIVCLALLAIDRLEAREAELVLGTAEIVEDIRRGKYLDEGLEYGLSLPDCGALIGQYAYRYSEEIRKDRDYWKQLAMDFHDAVHAEAEKRARIAI